MRLDELNDNELDATIRGLLPSIQRPAEWDEQQREQLMHFITTGETGRQSRHGRLADGVVQAEPLNTRGVDGAVSRRWWLVAAAVVLLVVGLTIIQRPASEPAPAQQPTVPPATTVPDDVSVPSLNGDLPRPDRFPIVTDSWPSAATATASWIATARSDSAAITQALIARSDEDTISDGVAISVTADPPTEALTGPPQIINVAGVDFHVYVSQGSPVRTSVVLPGTPTIKVSGIGAIAFVQAARGIPVENLNVADTDEYTFNIGQLPVGYDVVVPPTLFANRPVDAFTQADGTDGITAIVSAHNPLITAASVGTLDRVDINGTPGWLYDQGLWAVVRFQVSGTTWATITDASSAGDVLAFARSLEFVDETTWAARYKIAAPTLPETDLTIQTAEASATTEPPSVPHLRP